MKVHNSMTKTKEEFVPMNGNKVKMYACGITVYDDCHIGHAKQAITYDMMRNYLKYKGYDVTYVRNYTDVDDKIIAKANEAGMDAIEYSKDRIAEVERVMKLLKVEDPDIMPKASENIDNIIEFISKLIEKGHAYTTEKGDVYFSVKSFNEYGKLSKRNIDELINGVRKDVEESKKDPLDFALWKSAKEGEIYWESPWGKGRPGWHIECSAMNLANLGEQIDIHGGGKDLIFPHHENEVAQTEALTGKNFAKYWIHNGLITINGQKMSKSLGNSLTVKEALAKYSPEVIKYMLMSKHYATNIDINDKEFAIAEKHLFYFYNTIKEIDNFLKENEIIKESTIKTEMCDEIEKNYIEAMDDDFNTAAAYAYLFTVCKYINNLIKDNKVNIEDKKKILNDIKMKVIDLYGIVGILQEDVDEFIQKLVNKHLKNLDISIKEIEKKIEIRMNAKIEKDYKLADELRSELEEKGIVLFDTKSGTTWGIKELYSLV